MKKAHSHNGPVDRHMDIVAEGTKLLFVDFSTMVVAKVQRASMRFVRDFLGAIASIAHETSVFLQHSFSPFTHKTIA